MRSKASRARALLLAALAPAALLQGGCATPATADSFDEASPPPRLGRPAWVRAPARVGAYAGFAVGLVASVALLPVTWPLSVLADEGLGESRGTFLFFPAFVGAGTGHFVLGAVPDFLHYAARRAWGEEPLPPPYDHVSGQDRGTGTPGGE